MAKDNVLFYVGTTCGPDHRHTDRMHHGRKAAQAAAIATGDPCVIYRYHGREQYWDLIVDRSMPDASRLPLAQHVENVLFPKD